MPTIPINAPSTPPKTGTAWPIPLSAAAVLVALAAAPLDVADAAAPELVPVIVAPTLLEVVLVEVTSPVIELVTAVVLTIVEAGDVGTSLETMMPEGSEMLPIPLQTTFDSEDKASMKSSVSWLEQ